MRSTDALLWIKAVPRKCCLARRDFEAVWIEAPAADFDIGVGNVGDGDGSAEQRQGPVPSHGHIDSGSSMQTLRQSSSVGCSPTPGAAVQTAVSGAELGASLGGSTGVGYGVGIGARYGVGMGVTGTGVAGEQASAVQVESALQ